MKNVILFTTLFIALNPMIALGYSLFSSKKAASATSSTAYTARATHVSDGDTLWVKRSSDGQRIKLRLQGMDAPEICQAGGTESKAALQALVKDQVLHVDALATDDYGRSLTRVRLHNASGPDIAATQVKTGQAWSYGRGRSAGPYAKEENEARAAKRGVFAQANAEPPRAFRKRHGPCELPGKR
jgi:micrococcal nuclease